MAGLPPAWRALFLGFLLTGAVRLHAASDWQVPEASLRYKVELNRKPTHPSAGYFVQLPDGGILRGTTPATVVMTDDGKVLPSFLLWENAESGFSIVFADPGSQTKPVSVYLRNDRQAQTWKPESGLTPSAILCTAPGRDTLTAAQALAKLGRVDAEVHAENKAGIPKAPFSIGGDDTGRPQPGAFYMLSYLEAADAGKYWVAPFIREGQCEILIDGTKLNPKPHSNKWGGDGAFVDLTKGLHRVEIFQTAPGKGPYATTPGSGGLVYLTWRGPKEQFKEVESRVVKDKEIARSGLGNLTAVEARDGTPVAVASVNPALCYWFGEEEPLLIYDLHAMKAGQPAGTTWTWTFPEGAALEGEKVQWIFPGFRESRVKLTAKNGASTSTCVVPFFGFGTQGTSLEKPAHREAFRNVLASMLQVYPRSPDPVSGWSEAYWNNLLRTVEGGEGYNVLLRLFTDHLEAARKKLAPAQLYALQDLLLDEVQRARPREAAAWMQKFAPVSADSVRLNELKLREAELQMYYLGDRKAALAIFTPMAGLNNEFGERARIRLGDLAFLDGDLNKATSYYADVQNRARTRRNAAAPSGLVASQLISGKPVQPVAATPPDWRTSPLAMQGAAKSTVGATRGIGALQEVSLSENVRTLTEGDFLLEAHQALLAWEREFPLSKISGDFILRESALAMKTADWKRAQPMLEAYCREIDASSFLPDASSMLIACVTGAKEPPASIRDIIEKVKGRLKYHPVAAQLDKFLSTAK